MAVHGTDAVRIKKKVRTILIPPVEKGTTDIFQCMVRIKKVISGKRVGLRVTQNDIYTQFIRNVSGVDGKKKQIKC